VTEPIVRDALFPGGGWSVRLINWRVLGVTMTLTVLTGALISVIPALQTGTRNLADALRGGMRTGEGRSRARWGLTVLQAMFSVVLLVGAGLFIRSLQRVHAVDLGFDADRVVAVELHYPRAPRNPGETFGDWISRTGAVERERHRTIVEVARRVAGVEHAAVSVGLPFNGGVTLRLRVPGRDSVPALPGGGPWVTAVDADYFATVGATVRAGRVFGPQDREGSEPVMIVSETMATALWPGASAVDKCVQIGGDDAPCARVVGVVGDFHRSGIREDASMQYYVPIGQERGFSGSYVLVRPVGAATANWPALTRALADADPAIRSMDVRVLGDALEGEIRPFRLGVVAFGLSAALALVVAGLGLYSIMAHAVAWRRHEIGVRLALGARPSAIAALVARQGLGSATIGIVAGLIIALDARRWIEPQLFNTSASDPLVLIAVVAVLEMVALLAAWIPARRAVGVSPTEALRAE
jgi:predicted permease